MLLLIHSMQEPISFPSAYFFIVWLWIIQWKSIINCCISNCVKSWQNCAKYWNSCKWVCDAAKCMHRERAGQGSSRHRNRSGDQWHKCPVSIWFLIISFNLWTQVTHHTLTHTKTHVWVNRLAFINMYSPYRQPVSWATFVPLEWLCNVYVTQ